MSPYYVIRTPANGSAVYRSRVSHCITWHAEYDLFKPTISIQNSIFLNFRVNLIQFFVNFSRQEHDDITFMGCDQELRWLAFSIYPLSIFLYSPLRLKLAKFKQGLTNQWEIWLRSTILKSKWCTIYELTNLTAFRKCQFKLSKLPKTFCVQDEFRKDVKNKYDPFYYYIDIML